MQTLHDCITTVLEANDGKCLDTPEERMKLAEAIMVALKEWFAYCE